jgi:long-chain fatty acid transport protein
MKNLITSLILLGSICSRADIHHFKDIIIGERAAGMGGAYVAISDDPTGIYYNPAGVVYSRENYLSGSANGFHQTTKVYKDVFPGKNYTYQSRSLVPTFFGFTQSLSRKSKWGFAIAVPNSEYIDQDDTLDNLSDSTYASAKRRLFRQDTTYLFGPSYSMELMRNFTIGLTVFGFARTEKYIDVQWWKLLSTGPDYQFQNTYMTRTAYGFIPKLGIQFMPIKEVSVGLTFSKALNASGSGSLQQISGPTNSSGTLNEVANITTLDDYAWGIPTTETVTAGFAVFFTRRFLFTVDGEYHFYNPTYKEYPVQEVFNWAVGAEYYTSDSFALRTGIYTNNANTPELTSSSESRFDHVDLMGMSLSTSFYDAGSSVTFGASYSLGKGKGDVTGRNSLQDLEQSALTMYLMGSYQL